jgi:cytosine/adenosine deaminase-related metal-dependent hydrolase
MQKFHGLRPAAYLDKHEFLGPRLFAAHARYVDEGEIALLGQSRTIILHQANMAANRGVIPPIPALREAGCPIALGTDNNTNDVFEGGSRAVNQRKTIGSLEAGKKAQSASWEPASAGSIRLKADPTECACKGPRGVMCRGYSRSPTAVSAAGRMSPSRAIQT